MANGFGKMKTLEEMGIKLTAQEIHNKDFGRSLRGYNEEEVDAYLDEIIKDYELFARLFKEMQKHIYDMQNAANVEIPNTDDLLQRVRELEMFCWGKTKG
ncbi:DivIVA domain-containing protein [Paenibacillus terrigena]|uniref:DivIVA domain-containing protein n=1 Tax=Paenibacillus terrigena TaxID=369333 RepID=UPI0028D79725|nr:DivIVA domain-containing protein [Paenibacillus terrigena]